jgi:hypothetical protein
VALCGIGDVTGVGAVRYAGVGTVRNAGEGAPGTLGTLRTVAGSDVELCARTHHTT